MTYKMPEIEEMKTLADKLFKQADEFIEKMKAPSIEEERSCEGCKFIREKLHQNGIILAVCNHNIEEGLEVGKNYYLSKKLNPLKKIQVTKLCKQGNEDLADKVNEIVKFLNK